jgi:surface antigen
VTGAILIVSLVLGLALIKTDAHQDKQYLEREIQAKEQYINTRVEQLEKIQTELKELKEQKVETEAQLKEKTKREAELQKKIDQLNRELQAKKEREAEIARLAAARTAPVSYGGRGGSGTYSGTATYSSTGNTYTYGYCTWYVKNRRPDIPNGWGNANMWFYNAQGQGWPTGYSPRAGAVGQTSAGAEGHVVYVERVNGDGTIYISEMNYQGWGVKSYRTVASSQFRYIY